MCSARLVRCESDPVEAPLPKEANCRTPITNHGYHLLYLICVSRVICQVGASGSGSPKDRKRTRKTGRKADLIQPALPRFPSLAHIVLYHEIVSLWPLGLDVSRPGDSDPLSILTTGLPQHPSAPPHSRVKGSQQGGRKNQLQRALCQQTGNRDARPRRQPTDTNAQDQQEKEQKVDVDNQLGKLNLGARIRAWE